MPGIFGGQPTQVFGNSPDPPSSLVPDATDLHSGQRIHLASVNAIADVHNPANSADVASIAVNSEESNIGVGDHVHVYRLAVAATGEFTSFFGGDVASAYAAIVSTVDALNAIFEPELAISFVLVSEATTVYADADTDPYTGLDRSALLNENQSNLDDPNVLGASEYDFGHVFSFHETSGGGLAEIASVGRPGSKARGATIALDPLGSDFVATLAHEIGHQFGATHSFNSLEGACGGEGQHESESGYEVASGSTLMSYAGICPFTPGGDNLQDDPDLVFHSASFQQIHEYIAGNAHAAANSTIVIGNSIPLIDAGSDYIIPAGTPFMLAATGSDADAADVLTYSWEELDLGPSQSLPISDNGSSPLFRAFAPTSNPFRSFPRLTDLLDGADTAAIGEALPTTNRDLNFRATVRDGIGGVNSDDVLITVVDTGAAFSVASPVFWTGGNAQIITWDVAGTDGNGIDSENVSILLSVDGGLTFPFSLATVANDGSHTLVAPNINTSSARIKVQGNGHVFFDISDQDFAITADPALPGATIVQSANSTRVFEGSQTDTYDIALNNDPSGDVTVLITADAQSEISSDGVSFAASQTIVFNSAVPQTITVRAVDDAIEEGSHRSILKHTITDSTSVAYPVGTAINNLSVVVVDDELPPVVGIDFDIDGQPSPTNWAQQQFFNSGNPVNMLRDDGVETPIDLSFSFLSAGGLGLSTPAISNATNVPRHSPALAEIDGFTSFDGSAIRAIWSDLEPGKQYGVFVFGLEDQPSESYSQNVVISGDTTLPSFDQVLVDGVMQVNDEVGIDSRTLRSFEKVVAADSLGVISVTISSNADSNGIAIAGLAIRELALPLTPPALSLSIHSPSVSEAGGAAATTATVTRNSVTTNSLTVNLFSSDDGEVAVQETVVIPPGQEAVTFDIEAVDDFVVDGTQVINLSAAAAGHIDGVDSLEVIDNDQAGFIVTAPSEPLSLGESGLSAEVYVVLTAQPVEKVELTVSQSDITEVNVSVPRLVFSSDNWNAAQTVVVTGVADLLDDGDMGFDVVFSVDGSRSDVEFDSTVSATVAGVNADTPVSNILIQTTGGEIVISNQDTGGLFHFDVIDGTPIAFDFSGVSQSLEIGSLSGFDGTIEIQHQDDDHIEYGDGWSVGIPILINGSHSHVLTRESTTVHVRNETPHRNPRVIWDVNRDGKVSALDALHGINYLQRFGVGDLPVPTAGEETLSFYYDVTGDQRVSALDSLRIINQLALQSSQQGEGIKGVSSASVSQRKNVAEKVVSQQTVSIESDPQKNRGKIVGFATAMPSDIAEIKELIDDAKNRDSQESRQIAIDEILRSWLDL